jgi:hypothetical protein
MADFINRKIGTHISPDKHEAVFSTIKCKVKLQRTPLMVKHTCNSSTQKAEAGGSQVQSQPGLHSETLSQSNKQNSNKKCLFTLTSVNAIEKAGYTKKW